MVRVVLSSNYKMKAIRLAAIQGAQSDARTWSESKVAQAIQGHHR